jgi:hypothetical protein
MLTFPEIEDPGDEPIKWLRSLTEGAIYERVSDQGDTVQKAASFRTGMYSSEKLLTFEVVCLPMTSEYD